MIFPLDSFPDGFQAGPTTRKALLFIDLQNDFVSPKGRLPVSNVSSFLPKVPNLASKFRTKGQVIWARTEFLAPRPTISPELGSYTVVLKQFLAGEDGVDTDQVDVNNHNGAIEVDDGYDDLENDPEAFLSSSISPEQRCCLPGSAGCQYPDNIKDAVAETTDLDLLKTHYSAFEDTSLLLHLRTMLITELYICGSLSNVSVYATVLDAVRHGLLVTIVDDCVGYRQESCHIEALRQMVDSLGAEGIDYQELMDDLSGMLGDVIQEEKLTTRFEVSFPVAMASAHKPSTTISAIGRLHKCDTNPPTTCTQPPKPSQAQKVLSGTTVVDTYESSTAATHPTRRLQRHASSEPSPPRKRSTSDVEELEEAKQSKSSYKPSARRISYEAYSGNTEKNKTKSRMTRQAHNQESVGSYTPSSRPAFELSKFMGRHTYDKDMSSSEDERSPRRIPGPARRTGVSSTMTRKHRAKKPAKEFLGPEDVIGEGDSSIVLDVMPADTADSAFEELKRGVKWQKMLHRSGEVPRLVAVQGQPLEKAQICPIYRHPADESPILLPFNNTVSILRKKAEQVVQHPLNHVLIQYYRTGEDNISEHSDKTLDIVRDSSIVNSSLGAMRTMSLRTKKSSAASNMSDSSRKTQHVQLPHNSIFVLGLDTNKQWLHSIRADKRPDVEKSPAELGFNGERISLTFRHIGTFVDAEKRTIWGQGASSKTKEHAKTLSVGQKAEKEGERMIVAFGKENHQGAGFDWDAWYGDGFDVINFETKPV